jgi:hypothetical protein
VSVYAPISMRTLLRRGARKAVCTRDIKKGHQEYRQPEGTLKSLEHLEICPRCGQQFDSRVLHQVIYHNQPVHKRIALEYPSCQG